MTSDQRPHILHIITGLGDGGAEAVLYRLATYDDLHSHSVISLSGMGKYGPLLHEAGIAVEAMGLSPSLPSAARLMRMVQSVRRQAPDVVQTWMYHGDLLGGVAARLAGVRRVVWGLHNTTLDRQGTKWATRAIVRLNAQLSRRLPARIASCSEKGIQVHRDAGYAPGKLTVVHNGYDIGAFRPDANARQHIRAEWGITDDEILLGCVARFDPQKDHGNLLAAFRRVLDRQPAARLALIGTGMTHDNSALAGLIERNGVGQSVILCGRRSDIPAVMNGLDVHVLASAFGEAFPNVVCEAMACGTICAATDVGDTGLIIDSTGHICPPSDPDALASAILSAIERAGTAEASAACRARIESMFSLDRMAAGYAALWASTSPTG
ncbi:hypothetical protein MB02_14150 [Croceicoccus estronivorus]|uniref:glycosyltransferase n=1 Tax=Croceicoccus estronivorus TaxID=1172626 RepID=UPI00082EF48B|nr:glycosyltransferase [Croceicoccus estronivorus]OCC22907.1 hypothetical protein MB02_14150 [Croceicoccus estronivorus]